MPISRTVSKVYDIKHYLLGVGSSSLQSLRLEKLIWEVLSARGVT